jgi:NitT/TauT family transport system ATP-binding protein
MSVIIRVEQLSKSFIRESQEILVLHKVNLEIENGSFVVIVGPSGCGKTTLLNIVAGLLSPGSGAVYYKGTPINGPRLEVGYLTQKDTLMPWRTVERNIEMPLEIRGIPRQERRQRVAEFIRMVGLQGFEKLYPHELSGGMLRRASLARTLVTSPETLLMDEPFGALDAQLRLELQSELLSLWSQQRKSVLFVTHDIEEAIILGDRVVVLGTGGRLIADEPVTLRRPRDAAQIRFRPEFTSLHQRLWDALMQARQQQQRQEVSI